VVPGGADEDALGRHKAEDVGERVGRRVLPLKGNSTNVNMRRYKASRARNGTW